MSLKWWEFAENMRRRIGPCFKTFLLIWLLISFLFCYLTHLCPIRVCWLWNGQKPFVKNNCIFTTICYWIRLLSLSWVKHLMLFPHSHPLVGIFFTSFYRFFVSFSATLKDYNITTHSSFASQRNGKISFKGFLYHPSRSRSESPLSAMGHWETFAINCSTSFFLPSAHLMYYDKSSCDVCLLLILMPTEQGERVCGIRDFTDFF